MSEKQRPYGVGIAYRAGLHHEMMQYRREIDLLEVPTEDYIIRERNVQMDLDGALLREAVATLPCVAHGISMSIGSVEQHDQTYLEKTRDFMAETGIDVFSEHLAFHCMDGNDLSVFLSMPFEQASLEWLALKYNQARSVLGRPFALENVSYYFPIPDCSLAEIEYLNRLTELTDCSLLIDVTNVYNNATNHGYDAAEFIRGLPADRVSQLHLAGGHYADGMLQDSHSAPVFDEVWELLDVALEHTSAEIVILERDSNFIPFSGVMKDVRRAREIFYRHRSDSPPEPQTKGALASSDAATAALDPLAVEFANLRSFQRAILRQITDDDYRERVGSKAELALIDYPMTPDWFSRWQHCDQQRIAYLSEKWHGVQRHRRDTRRRYQQFELQQWMSEGV